MRPRIQVLVRCPDHNERLRHRLRLEVWGYEPVWTLEVIAPLMRCIIVDGHNPDTVATLRQLWAEEAIIVIVGNACDADAHLRHGADYVLSREECGRDLYRQLRWAVDAWTVCKRGPKPEGVRFVSVARMRGAA